MMRIEEAKVIFKIPVDIYQAIHERMYMELHDTSFEPNIQDYIKYVIITHCADKTIARRFIEPQIQAVQSVIAKGTYIEQIAAISIINYISSLVKPIFDGFLEEIRIHYPACPKQIVLSSNDVYIEFEIYFD